MNNRRNFIVLFLQAAVAFLMAPWKRLLPAEWKIGEAPACVPSVGQTAESAEKGRYVRLEIWTRQNGSCQPSGRFVRAYCAFGPVGNHKMVHVAPIEDWWVVTAAEC